MRRLCFLVVVAVSFSAATANAADSLRLVVVATVDGRKVLHDGALSFVVKSTNGERPSECENRFFWTTSVTLRGGDLIHSCEDSAVWKVQGGYPVGWVTDKSTGAQLPIIAVAEPTPVPPTPVMRPTGKVP